MCSVVDTPHRKKKKTKHVALLAGKRQDASLGKSAKKGACDKGKKKRGGKSPRLTRASSSPHLTRREGNHFWEKKKEGQDPSQLVGGEKAHSKRISTPLWGEKEGDLLTLQGSFAINGKAEMEELVFSS